MVNRVGGRFQLTSARPVERLRGRGPGPGRVREIVRFTRPDLLNRITLTELINPIPIERSKIPRFAQQFPAAVAYIYIAYDLLAAFQPTNCFNHS